MKKGIIYTILSILVVNLFSINVDSLKQEFLISKEDSLKLKTAHQLYAHYFDKNEDSAYYYVSEKCRISKDISVEKYIKNLRQKATCLERMARYDESIKIHFEAIELSKKNNLKLEEADAYISLSYLYLNLKKNNEAEKYLFDAEKIYLEINDKELLANCYNAFGTFYKNQEEYNKAIEYHTKSLEIRKELKDSLGMSFSFNNIGIVHKQMEDYNTALTYYKESLKIKEKLNNVKGQAGSNINISDILLTQKKYAEAAKYVEKGILLADSAKAQLFLSIGYQKAHSIFAGLGRMDKAYEYSQKYNQLYEKLYNESSNRAITEMETKYASEKKQREIEMLNAQNEINQMQLDKANNLKKIFIAGSFLILIVIFALFFGFNSKRKALKMQQEINQKLEEKNEKILHQSLIIEQKNKDITDSINYAKRIQEALMPSKTEINKHHPNSFMFYLPRDIVSGDFYWYTRIGSYSIFALADCTGHGVPGALMSMIGINLLNQIVKEGDVTSPGVALKMLDNKINQTFNIHRNEELTSSDGMDIALIAYNEETKVLQYSGANRPLLVTKQNELIEVKPTKHSIGGVSAAVKHFEDHEIKLEKDSNIYLFSDGYTDQFGGEKGKKLKYKPFKDFLVSIIDKPMNEQGEIVAKKFFDWKNNLEQIDDICVMGIRV